jgi:chemosensory pili system protein ChpA (sensor histidine kinase/response regulator)
MRGSATWIEEEVTRVESEPGFPALRQARRPRVVIAEDCEHVVRALRRFLRRANFDVLVARDGVEALCAIRESEPDLLLLDLGLPRMHGFKLLHRLRTAAQRIDVPVVVLTGDTDPASLERAARFGVRRVLLKPTPAPVVVAVLEEVLAES